jgi:hypothetical protein
MAKPKTQPPEEEKPKAPEAPPRTERGEKQEKYEKHEKHEKHEKGEPEKGEKHEKTEIGIMGSILAGILIIVFGLLIFFARVYGFQELWWPIFVICIGIAIIAYAIIASSSRRRSPAPPS